MYEKLDEELRETMFHNLFRMKKVKAIQAALMFMCMVLAAVQLIFVIVGGFNVYCFIGLVMNIVVFLTGTYGYQREKLHMALVFLNVIAAGAYFIWHPESSLLLRIGIMQHVYLAGIMFFYRKVGREKEELSYEIGFPYFSELAFISTDDKRYVPAEDIHKKPENTEMQKIAAEEKPDDVLYQKKPVYMDELPGIDTSNLDTSVIRNETANSSFNYRQMSEPAADKNTVSAGEVPEYDKELLHENLKKMKNFKRLQGALFILDLIIVLVAISDAGNGLAATARYNEPFRLLHFLSGLAAIIASILTVTCTDRRDLIKMGAYAFAAAGTFLTIAFFDGFYFATFAVCAAQMCFTLILCNYHDYLKSQFGYPYFKESMIHKQVYRREYAPSETLNFTQRKMDDV